MLNNLSGEQAAKAEEIILARMKAGKFTFRQLFMAADEALGLGGSMRDPTTYRLADRLIQRERKAGRIRQTAVRGDWEPVEKSA